MTIFNLVAADKRILQTFALDDEIYEFTPLQKDKLETDSMLLSRGDHTREAAAWEEWLISISSARPRIRNKQTNRQKETERRQWKANHPCRQTGPLSGANWRGARASLFCLDTSRQCCDRVQRVTRDQDLWPRFYSLRRLSAAVFWKGCRPPLTTEHLPKRRRTVTVDAAGG